MRMNRGVGLLVCLFLAASVSVAQSPNGTVSGIVLDPSGGLIVGADVLIINNATGVQYPGKANSEGYYVVPNIPPGTYRIQVSNSGFKTIIKPDIVVHVEDALAINFTLPIGAASEIVTVEGGAPLINTENAAVSTVVDRQFAENLPLNGRSFQSLIYLTPGVVVVPSNSSDGGQFTVNGQRAASNYWMVDGVSGNIGTSVGSFPGNGFGGALGSFSVQGGTNSLVSVDALQEFRIQTSTYAPEFGRTPGGQISIVTRSGTNQFHGTVFDYVRNDVLDANNWFADYDHLPKPLEQQNDFGGTFGGPIVRDKTFFFFSYEGLRLQLPQVAETTVPDLNSRQSAVPAMQPFLNAYPFDPKQADLGSGIAQFNASFSNSSTLDAYSLRVDHKLLDTVTLFGRYNYSPSENVQRGAGSTPLSVLTRPRIVVQTATVGLTWAISPIIANDFRFNYSRVDGSSSASLDSFGGAVPPSLLPFPSPYTNNNAEFGFYPYYLTRGLLESGTSGDTLQQQVNIVDSVSFTKGSHALKFGVDFRRLSPMVAPQLYTQASYFFTLSAAEAGNASLGIIQAQRAATVLFRNWGTYAQDTWRLAPRLTLTYGLRWDLDLAPSSLSGPSIPAVTGYNLNNFSELAIAAPGTPPFKTTYGNVAPRIGLAYQLNQNQNRETVVRGGFGVFYDLVSSQVNGAFLAGPPFSAFNILSGAAFPFEATNSTPPLIPSVGTLSQLDGVLNPNLKLPYTLEWNVAVEQAMGRQQTLSISYVGASGRRLLQTSVVEQPPTNPDVSGTFVDNTASSNYNALQMQFQRRLSHGLQGLASYTWAHSVDDGSAGSAELLGNYGAPRSSPNANRGPSDFDIRNAFSAGMTYDITMPKTNAITNAILRGWSIESLILVRSAPPVHVSDSFPQVINGISIPFRPDLVPGQPLYLYGANCASVEQALGNLAPGQGCPGGKALNPNAFTDPPSTPAGCNPNVDYPCNFARQGTLPRNFLRGFGATQWDFGVHREFPIRDSIKLQFRAEMFNVLNHPNFGQPNGSFLSLANGGPAGFGLSSQTLGQYLDGGGTNGSNVGSGTFSPLYQIGGPRSIQLALKLFF